MLAGNAAKLVDRVHPGDVVIVHDPQPAGMIQALRDAGATVVWRCHVGIEDPNELTREAWDFLRPYVMPAEVYVFSREEFVWEGLDRDPAVVIHPTIDAFAPKNLELDPATAAAALRASGLVAGEQEESATFQRLDGTPGRIERRADPIEEQRLQPETPTVLQVSRWDALKDPIGVIRGFGEHVAADTGPTWSTPRRQPRPSPTTPRASKSCATWSRHAKPSTRKREAGSTSAPCRWRTRTRTPSW